MHLAQREVIRTRVDINGNSAFDSLIIFHFNRIVNEVKAGVKCGEVRLMFACDGTKAADRYDLADRDKAGAPHECCGGLNNVDYSKVKRK